MKKICKNCRWWERIKLKIELNQQRDALENLKYMIQEYKKENEFKLCTNQKHYLPKFIIGN